jgi:thymidylate kinase
MHYRHVILEGKPTTGKTEISDLFKIYFPDQIRILPELTTTLVRKHKLNILEHRRELNDLLAEAVPARSAEVRRLLAAEPDRLILEESHMGVHWAYSKYLADEHFLELYDGGLAGEILEPDLYLRLDIPIEVSVRRQIARATRDVEVDDTIVRNMFANLNAWHADRGTENLVVVDTDRAPDDVVRDLMTLLGLVYRRAES